MRVPRRLFLAVIATAAVTGCDRAAENPAAVTPEEAQQLNDAAAMLDNDSVSANAVEIDDNGD